jgi:TonB family protein
VNNFDIARTLTLLFAALTLGAATALGSKPAAERTKPKMQIIGDRPDADRAATLAFLQDPKSVFVATPFPKYPLEARRRRQTGRAVVRLSVDEAGRVTEVRLIKSSGHQILDDAGVIACRSWRGKPGPRREVDLPLTYTLGTSAHERRSELSPYMKQTMRSPELSR